MRKSLWIIPVLLLFAAIGVPNAHADSVIFTCSGTCTFLPTAPDVSFPAPVTIDVTYDSTLFVIALATGDSPSNSYGWMAYESGGSPVDFEIDDVTTGDVESVGVMSMSPTLAEEGQLTFVPEPSSFALMLVGVGIVFAMRNRIGQGLPQAS